MQTTLCNKTFLRDGEELEPEEVVDVGPDRAPRPLPEGNVQEGLALGLEAGEDFPTVHTGFQDLQGDLASHRFLLLGEEDLGEPALANRLTQGVGPYSGSEIDFIRVSGKGILFFRGQEGPNSGS